MKKIITISILFALFLSATQIFAASTNTSKSSDCAQIVLETGDIIAANIIQITETEVKYKRCGKANDPEIILSLKRALKIKDADGSDIWVRPIVKRDDDDNNKPTTQKLNGFALTSMILGILGAVLSFFGLGLIPAILAIIFGSIGLYKIKQNPDKYRGKLMALAGLICGLSAIGILIYLLLLIL